NRTREMLRASLIDAGICIVAVALAVPFGSNWVAAAIAGSGLTVRLPVQFALASAKGPVTFRDLVGAVMPSAVAAMSVAFLVALMRSLLPQALPPLAGLALAMLAGAAATLILYFAMPKSRRALREFRGLLRTLKGTPQVPAFGG